MFHKRFIYRQLTASWRQTTVFILCVALSLITLVSLGGFGESVNESLLRDARQLLAGDIIVDSGFPFEAGTEQKLNELAAEDGIDLALYYYFFSVVRQTEGTETLLTEIKAVEPGYPFYGEVILASGRPFGDVLAPGNVIVAQDLLDRLALAVGDQLNVGEVAFTIADVVISEPDRPVDFFQLGPRVFLAAADLESTQLIREGSRVQYTALLKIDNPDQVDQVAADIETVINIDNETVNTFRTNQSGIQSFFDNFLTFLNLIGIFTLMLAGIGIQSSLSAFLKEREKTIAILRTIGATGQFVVRQYLAVVAVLGLIGTIIGGLVGFALQFVFPVLFGPFLPPQVEFSLSPAAVGQALLLGLFVVTAFTFIPIYQTQEFKPYFIFRKETLPFRRGWAYYATLVVLFLFFVGMVFGYLQRPLDTIYFVIGVVCLVLLTALLTWGVLWLLRRQKLKPLAPRQALRGLFRPRNSTNAIIITLSASLAVLFTIYLLERNLDASFVQAFPEDTPNVFVLDIQPDQVADFEQELAAQLDKEVANDVTFFPVVRGQIETINGEPIERQTAEERNSGEEDFDRLSSVFNLTYRDDLLESESLVDGEGLFLSQDGGMAEVSIMDFLLEQYPFEIGDVIEFNIQGIRLDARVTSIRSQADDGGVQPIFTFVFRPQDLENAPQSIFTAVRVPAEEIPALQNVMVGLFPNITFINVSAAIETFAELVGNITTIIRFFTLFSIVAGVLIIVSSVFATRLARIQEAVYFKILGARGRFVLQVFTLENVFLGLISALLGVLLSQLGSWILVTQVFELDYESYAGSSAVLIALTIALVTAVGLMASLSILNQRPIVFLREQAGD